LHFFFFVVVEVVDDPTNQNNQATNQTNSPTNPLPSVIFHLGFHQQKIPKPTKTIIQGLMVTKKHRRNGP